MSHAIVHVEIPSGDPQEAAKFYGDLFGWKIEVDQMYDYVQFVPESGPGGAFPKADGEMARLGEVLVYYHTEDIDATLARAEQLGGKVALPKTEIPHVGGFALFNDPSGNRMGLFSEGGSGEG
ncbi:MAG: VOC family protein [Chloroflexi bacterium]|nr:VOC family protein [Chloroflexota bacterium]